MADDPPFGRKDALEDVLVHHDLREVGRRERQPDVDAAAQHAKKEPYRIGREKKASQVAIRNERLDAALRAEATIRGGLSASRECANLIRPDLMRCLSLNLNNKWPSISQIKAGISRINRSALLELTGK